MRVKRKGTLRGRKSDTPKNVSVGSLKKKHRE